jgi:hypothetical protein
LRSTRWEQLVKQISETNYVRKYAGIFDNFGQFWAKISASNSYLWKRVATLVVNLHHHTLTSEHRRLVLASFSLSSFSFSAFAASNSSSKSELLYDLSIPEADSFLSLLNVAAAQVDIKTKV